MRIVQKVNHVQQKGGPKVIFLFILQCVRIAQMLEGGAVALDADSMRVVGEIALTCTMLYVFVLCNNVVGSYQAHSLCHLLGNDIRHDATDLQTCPIDVQDDGEDISSCENWDVDMVVKFCFGNYMGRHAVIISRPTSDGYVRVRTMGSSADDSEEAIDADCTDLQLAQPRKRDCVKVLTGPFKDHIGNVKMVLEETEVVLDNLPPVDIIPLRHVAWIHRSAGESNATNGSVDSATHIIRPEVIGRMRKLECFFCNTTGDGLVSLV